MLPGGAQAHPNPTVSSRRVRRLPVERNEPLRLRRVTASGQRIYSNKWFNATDDWLADFTVTVANKSNKGIVYAAVQLQFSPPAGSSRPIAIDNVEYGNNAVLSRPLGTTDFASILRPGQVADLRFPRERFEVLREALPQIGRMHGVEELGLRIDRVVFDDGTMWRAGSLFVRDSLRNDSWMNSDIASFKRPVNRREAVFVFAVWSASDSRINSGITPWNGLLAPASFGPCNNLLEWSDNLSCSEGSSCTYPYDQMSLPTGGNYYPAAASALCKYGSQSCNVWHDTIVANSCGSGGGGGGGIGVGCSDDDECDFGYYCDPWGECQRYEE